MINSHITIWASTMKIKNITETVAGNVASVAMPLGATRKRTTETVKVAGLQPAEKVMTGKSKKKGPYANSLTEGKMKELAMDLKSGVDGLTDIEFKKKYGKTKDEMRKSLKQNPEQRKEIAEGSEDPVWNKGTSMPKDYTCHCGLYVHPSRRNPKAIHTSDCPYAKKQDEKKDVSEAKLDEEDVIIVPGQGRKFKTGFIPHSKDRTDHEVEMALSDLFQAAKNAKQVYEIVKTYSEERGLEGWVQEKIIKANDYLNSIREYLEHKQLTDEGVLGQVAGGVAGAMLGKTPSAAMVGAELGSDLQDKLANESGAGVIAGGLQYEQHEVESGPWAKANDTMKTIFDAAKANKQALITIGNKSGTISPSYAKAIVNVYNSARKQNRENEVLHMFIDTNKFTKLLASPMFKQIANDYENEKKIDLDKLSKAKYYDVIGSETGSEKKPETKHWIAEKAVSKAQQKFMGMVHAAQKGEKPASKEVAKVAKSMPKKAAKDFAKTKHKGLPEKVKKDNE